MKQLTIRDRRVRNLMLQDDLALKLHDARCTTLVSYIEQGRVMPTRRDMAALCETLGCHPTDLYDPEDLDLSLNAPAMASTVSTGGRGHEGMVELRVWLRPEEKETLGKAVEFLGYRNVAEWLREMRRNTLARYFKQCAMTAQKAP